MASGSISPLAREYVSDWCKRHPFGENVYCLDGDTLERLEKHASHQFHKELRRALIGVLNEAFYNDTSLNLIQTDLRASRGSLYRCRLTALENCLAIPPPGEIIEYSIMEKAWDQMSATNQACMNHLVRSRDAYPPSELSIDLLFVQDAEAAKQAQVYNRVLYLAVGTAIKALDERYALPVEVEVVDLQS
jgi:hypothetical protein